LTVDDLVDAVVVGGERVAQDIEVMVDGRGRNKAITAARELRHPFFDIYDDGFEIILRCSYCRLSLCTGDESYVVEGIVAFATHAVEEGEGRGQTGVKMLSSELDDGYVMSKLDARTLAVAKHERQRTLQHRLIGRLIGGFFVDPEVLTGGSGFFVCVGEEAADLFGIDLLGPGSRYHR
jgi:hypothetical protein